MDLRSRFAAIGAAAACTLLLLMVPTASADTSPDGWAHRSTQSVSPDGFSVRSSTATAQVSPDGFSVRSAPSIAQVSPDGFSVRSAPVVGQDGWVAASVELPRTEPVLDGWAAGAAGETYFQGIDGWSYAAVTGETEVAQSRPESLPPPRTTTPPFELVGFAAALTAAAIAGVMYEIYRRRHHFPV